MFEEDDYISDEDSYPPLASQVRISIHFIKGIQ